jgi:MFS family permease
MLSYVKDEGRVGYTNIWIFGTASAMGVTPIAVGFAIDWLGLWGFRTCFIVSCVLGFSCAIVSPWVIRDGKPIENLLGRMMNPTLPLRTLGRIAWITMGLHESNRLGKEKAEATDANIHSGC